MSILAANVERGPYPLEQRICHLVIDEELLDAVFKVTFKVASGEDHHCSV